MAKRPFFIPTRNKEELVKTHSVKFTWSSGFAKSQKQKSILSFHKSISKEFKSDKILEISTKSENKLGTQLSAFNLKINFKDKEYFLEILAWLDARAIKKSSEMMKREYDKLKRQNRGK